MIYLDEVTKIYKTGEESLKDVTLNIEKGEFVSIVGFSGAGKTTLLKLILGEIKPTKGSVYFNSVNISKLNQSKLNKHRRNIGTVFQDFRLVYNKNVYENVAFAMEAAGKSNEEVKKTVPHVLKLVGLEDKGRRFPNELSGGEKQRASIARAIVNNPDVIIADEPTGNLDPINTTDIMELLKKINSFGTTVILATHDKGIVNTLRKRVVTITNGKITKDDKEGTFVL
ncbi:cell division ATP-binding protein FtsE [Candidatus Campbellbacteria bacterium]|nr:MAG: cell division ATP-binding protein FtsE [Candidatus Campbellbacteria bacterium]